MRSAYCLLMTRCNYVLSATAHNAYRFVGKQTIHSIELLYKSQTNVHIHIQLLQEDCWRAHIKGLNHSCGNTRISV